MGKRGPQPKPEEEKYALLTYACPKDLAAEVKEHIPKGERSGIIQACLCREVKRRKKAKEGADDVVP